MPATRLRLRHLYLPLYLLGAVVLLLCAAAGIAAAARGWPIAVLPFAFAAALAGAAIWLRRVPPHGPAARAAYRALETAIDTAPPGPLRCADHYLDPRPSRAIPELDRWHFSAPGHADDPDPIVVTETYTLLWVPPLVLHHTSADWATDHQAPPHADTMSARDAARFLWHTLRTGQGFASADEMHTLADELRTAEPTQT